MNFSSMIKGEILSAGFESSCCLVSALSAFLHTTVSLTYGGGKIGFEAVTESDGCAAFCRENIKKLFGADCEVIKEADKLTSKEKIILRYGGGDCADILAELCLVGKDSGRDIEFGINRYLTENECCKRAYIKGAFLGSGSATLPKEGGAAGYHAEFVFSNYLMANDFCALAAENDIFLKQIERKGSFVTYIKSSQGISDLLAFMNANKSVMYLQDVMIKKSFNNDLNRRFNCELGNMNKQVNASVSQKLAIEEIDELLGLENLPPQLEQVCRARLAMPEATLGELAEKMSLTKSCINHRIRKIMKIYENLAEK